RALGIHTAAEMRDAAAQGRLLDVPGIGTKTEARLLEALAREADPQPRQGLLLNRALELVGGIAAALDGEVAGDVRRWRDSCERLAVVCAAPDPQPALDRFAGLPQIVALVEQDARRRPAKSRRCCSRNPALSSRRSTSSSPLLRSSSRSDTGERDARSSATRAGTDLGSSAVS